MAVADLNKIDDKLKEMYKEQTVNSSETSNSFVDKSDLLFEQMNFIAVYNKQALHLI